MSFLSHECHIPNPPHPDWCDHPDNIWQAVQTMKLLLLMPPLLGPNIFLRALFPQKPPIWESLKLIFIHRLQAIYITNLN